MKILLIAPASGRWHHVGQRPLLNGKTFRFSMLSLLSVAAASPKDVDIQIIDEQIEAIPWGGLYDLVGITCMTAAAPRAYDIADRFRKEGIPVVLGGMHPTLCTDDARHHADAVVVGDAEGIWPRVIADARTGRLRQIYRCTHTPDLVGLNPPPRHLLDRRKYGTIHAIQATRGCPNRCDFCSVSAFHQATYRMRPVDEVIAEAKRIPSRFFIFMDDNLTADRDYAEQLFEALIPLGKQWITQSTLEIADDPRFVKLVARAGCVGVFVGMETFAPQNLEAVNKGFNRVETYRDAIDLLHSAGIGVEAGIVFGFDQDQPKVFQDTLDMLDRLEIDAAQISIFTPLPGTPRFDEMKTRIVDRDWSHYDFHHAVFQPAGMSAMQLKDGHDWITRQFYSPSRILRRTWRYMRRAKSLSSFLFFLSVNLAYLTRIRSWKIRGRNPAHQQAATVEPWPLYTPAGVRQL